MTKGHFRRGRGGRGQGASSSNRVEKPQLTHFLCIPLVNEGSRPQLQQAMDDFLTQPRHNTFHEAAIRPIGTFHLTLGMMSLTTDERLQEAIQFLKDLDLDKILADIPPTTISRETADDSPDSPVDLRISLNPLVAMDGEDDKARVLYSVPYDPTSRLPRFAEKLQLLFQDKNLVIDENRPLKLHATVVNTTYSKRYGFPRQFDATGVLERAKDLVWATNVRLDRVAICKMGAKDVKNAEGLVVGAEYEELASVPLPN